MPKTLIQERFDNLVSNIIWPQFKAKGYRKTGNNFRFYNIDGWGKIVNIQKSAFGDKNNISFTINTGLYLPEADTIFEIPRGEKFLEPDCLVRKRIGKLNGLQKDLWYDLNEKAPPNDLEGRISQDFSQFILPYLEKIQSRDDILKQIIREHTPNEEKAIRTLFICGYQEEARQWIEEEINNTIYRTWREQLVKLRNSLA
ncbi:hypothetical protein ACVWYF_003551 [Hymenobacter sp. UYAg731]